MMGDAADGRARDAFLLQLSDGLRAISDPLALLRTALEMVGRQLGANRAGYFDVEEATGTLSYPMGWGDGVLEPFLGRRRISTLFGDALIARMRAGETVSIHDVENDPLAVSGSFAAVGARATLRVPLMRNGAWIAGLFVSQAEARRWTAEEGEILEGVLARTWEALERARAEAGLHATRARQEFLSDLVLAQRAATDEPQLLAHAAEAVGRFLEVDRTGFFEPPDDDTVVFANCWTAGMLPVLDGPFPAVGIGTAALALIRAGQAVVFSDASRDAVVAGSVFPQIGALAGIGAPIVRHGRWQAGLYVNAAAPRPWLADEIDVVKTVVELTWDAVERVRAQGALREANAGLERRIHEARADLEIANAALERRVADLHASGARQRFRVELSDALRGLSVPEDIVTAMSGRLGHQLGVDQVSYYRIEGGCYVIEREWRTERSPGMVGRHRLAEFASGTVGAIAAGEVLRLDDTRTAEDAAAFAAAGALAVISVPVTRNGVWAGGLHVHQAEPRAWNDDEETLVREVAAQTWAAVERARAETSLRELNETLELQVEERTAELDRAWRLSQELRVVALPDGTLEAVNPLWTEALGWATDELIGTKFIGYTHPDDLDATNAAFSGIFEKPLVEPYEYRFRHKNGTYRRFAWTGAFEAGKVYASGRDVTLARAQEEALHRAEEQLRQSQKMEAVGQLTGGLAHDFNNLLTGVTGSLDLLQSRMRQGRLTDVERFVTAAQGAAQRAAALTHRLLAFSRRQTLDPKPTDVNRLVAGMEELIRRTVGPAVAFETVGAGGLWNTLVDPGQLENALLNLCINARDAMPDGGRITVETANRWLDDRAAKERELVPGQYVSLCVSDTGTGMPANVIARAFDPFFTTKPIGQGTGLGLSMIYGFVRQSGGQVRIYSEVAQGTMVCLYLPRHLGEEGEIGVVADFADAPRADVGETVLVVDDEPTVRMLVTEVLEELGYAAIEAADGSSGLKVLQSDVRIDLLVTDVGLPGGMNGRQVADAARVARPGLKVLFITGYAENAVLNHGHLAHGMHVMTKPFAMEALASRIKTLISEPAT